MKNRIGQNKFYFILTAAFLFASVQSHGQAMKNPVNYLGIPGPVSVQKVPHQLVWSSHPDPSLYKQEYLAAGDAFPNYKSMVTIDFVLTESTVDQAVAAKLRDLEQLKKSNHDVNFEVISNAATGEKIIDFLIGQNAADEQKSLIERDVYRFKAVKTKTGQRGIILFAVSTRKYGKDIKPFLLKLKNEKPVLVSEVAKFAIPVVNITK